MLVIPVFKSKRQTDQEFRVILNYIVSLSVPWVIQDPVSKINQIDSQQGNTKGCRFKT